MLEYNLDKSQIASTFNKAADTYDEYAVLQQEICRRLLERLSAIPDQPKQIIDLGSGTGQGIAGLHQCYPQATLYGLDLAEAMLQKTVLLNQPSFLIRGDTEQLPIKEASIDMIFSNLMLQWCRFDLVVSEFLRILKPGGVVLFSTFGPDTLKELRQCWEQIDHYQHIHDFSDLKELGDVLLAGGLQRVVMDTESLVMTYRSVRDLMIDLKKIGAHNISNNRHRGLVGKEKNQKLITLYEEHRQQNLLPATYEIIYGYAHKAQINNK